MTETTTIDLIRHGEVEGGSRFRGSTDDPLTKLGWQQMQQTLEAGSDWTHIISSPLQRCAKFTEYWAEKNKLPYSLDNGFQEMHFGDWEGKTSDDLSATDPDALQRFWQDPNKHAPNNAELLSDFRQRVLNAWQSLIHRQQGQHILLISHGGPIRIILADILEMPLHALLRLEVPLAAISRIRVYHAQKQPPSASLVFHAGSL
ncbi:histidine phosphatase family protein [Candidatus Nitrotoga sp. M5]|uniref:histidine phosphatase family protein n=1 Tax=Candidatus Nitrotoga sp. M5 TaxID=2890409 RepID=UPI001EF5B7E4|nr:alpha-ribazole phosphatase family protein [Candidatus Nitrotoga sp. M5]CAH1387367.1 Alpha-ribazole-5'-phosphate phosphatase [Candidatus Nitrotoga sp. M5]